MRFSLKTNENAGYKRIAADDLEFYIDMEDVGCLNNLAELELITIEYNIFFLQTTAAIALRFQ
jgi:hypothetical protein